MKPPNKWLFIFGVSVHNYLERWLIQKALNMHLVVMMI